MGMLYFKLFEDLLESWSALTDEECGRLVRAMAQYRRTGQPPDLLGNERFVFPIQQAQMDRDLVAYERRCQVNRENGRLGGRAKAQNNPLGLLASQPGQDKDQDKDKEKEKDQDKDQEFPPVPPRRGAGFSRSFSQLIDEEVGPS